MQVATTLAVRKATNTRWPEPRPLVAQENSHVLSELEERVDRERGGFDDRQEISLQQQQRLQQRQQPARQNQSRPPG